MKFSHILGILILAGGSFWGWRAHQQTEAAEMLHRQALVEAAALGITSSNGKEDSATKVRQRQQEKSQRKVKEFADRLIAFNREFKEAEKAGKGEDEARRKRGLEMMEALMSLSGEELKMLVAELQSRTNIEAAEKQNILGFSLMMLAQQHPETALAIISESGDFMKGNPMGDYVLTAALTQLAKDSPTAAMEWISANGEKVPDLNRTKTAIVVGAAQKDISLAFQMMVDLKLGTGSVAWQLAQTAQTSEQQTDFLKAMRAKLDTISDEKERTELLEQGMSSLFNKVISGGYEDAVKWVTTAGLTEKEQEQFIDSIGNTGKGTPQWLDWLSTQKQDPERVEGRIKSLFSNWTRNDYVAAGEWLTQAPAGAAKESATEAYIEAISTYDADTAYQWAKTLPEEKQKSSIRQIYQNLKRKDPAAAEAYATQHSLEK